MERKASVTIVSAITVKVLEFSRVIPREINKSADFIDGDITIDTANKIYEINMLMQADGGK